MANYYGTGRTNWFAVKDAEAFKAEMEKFSVEVGEDVIDEQPVYALFGLSDEGMPWSYWDEDTDDHIDIEWDKVLSRHLADDWVCVLQEVGNEKMRYVGGMSLAFNNKGDSKHIMLDDIYEAAKDFGKNLNRI